MASTTPSLSDLFEKLFTEIGHPEHQHQPFFGFKDDKVSEEYAFPYFLWAHSYLNAAAQLAIKTEIDGLTDLYRHLVVLNLCRHAIELYLKFAVTAIRKIRPTALKKPHNHQLLQLWNEVDDWASSTPELNKYKPYQLNAKAAVADFAELDKRSDRFRYPFDRESRMIGDNTINLYRTLAAAVEVFYWLNRVEEHFQYLDRRAHQQDVTCS